MAIRDSATLSRQRVAIDPAVWPLLAGLRFFFATWVLFDHTYNFGPADRAMPVFTKSGLVAVMCFLVISGFSIHHSIATRPQGYAARRFWRIMPINVLAVGIGWFAWSVLGLTGGYGTPPTPPHWWQFVGSLLLLQSLLPVMIHFLFPAWSLSIEAIYYVAAPWLVRMRDGPIWAIAAASALLFVVWPYVWDIYIASPTYGISAFALVWSFLAGWIAYSSPRHPYLLSGFLAAGFLSFWTQSRYFGIVDFTSAAANCCAWLLTLWVVYYHRTLPPRAKPLSSALNYLGDVSFPLYLLHYPVLFSLTSSVLKTHPDWNYGITHVVAALIVAVLALHFVDRPMRGGIIVQSQSQKST